MHRRTVPRPLLVVPLLLLVALVCVLAVQGSVHTEYSADHRTHRPIAADRVPQSVAAGGPVLDTTGPRPRSLRVPDRTIALTFDDGPDPVWTPRVLEVLRKHHVKGTFFVTGQMAARHPELVRRMVREGHEIGVHTFSHPDLARQDPKLIDRELSRTQLALAGAAGIRSSLFRPPYSSTPEALDNLSWPVVRRIGEKGYLTVLIDRDTQDWRRPGTRAIADAATPRTGDEGAIVLLHDSGGERSQTVTAVDRLIPRLQERGHRFATVGDALGAETANHPVSGAELWRGRAFVAAVGLSNAAVPALLGLLSAVGLLVLARFGAMLALARLHARRRGGDFSWGPPVTEPVSVVVPAYNERECIANTVRSLAASDHPVEIVVVDDGSTDGTADIVEAMGLPRVRVVRRPNGGKSAALNTGMALARHGLVVMMDGDTVFEPSTVRRLVQPFADPRVGAVAGNAKVGNRGTLIGRWQHIEYVMGFNLDRRMYDLLRCMPTVPGAVGAFRRRALAEAGWMSEDTLAEDTDVTMALHRAGWRVVYEEHARAWTEAPTGIGQLWRQRYRWSYGTMQAMWKHRHALVEGGASGRFGRVGLPLVVLFQVLAPLLAPLVDVFLVYGLVFQDPARTVFAWIALLGVQALCAAYAFRLDREPMRVLWALPLQQVVYRQLMYLVLLQSTVTALTGGRLRWQKLRRTGEVEAPPTPSGRTPSGRAGGAPAGAPAPR